MAALGRVLFEFGRALENTKLPEHPDYEQACAAFIKTRNNAVTSWWTRRRVRSITASMRLPSQPKLIKCPAYGGLGGKPGNRKRMGWDSNPGYPYEYSSFQDCRLRPLGHPSINTMQTAVSCGIAKSSKSSEASKFTIGYRLSGIRERSLTWAEMLPESGNVPAIFAQTIQPFGRCTRRRSNTRIDTSQSVAR